MAHDPTQLPSALPWPADDGACDHLIGTRLPEVELQATIGTPVVFGSNLSPWNVVYIYPRTGVPGVDMPEGWDAIPGARGCTPQSCSYRDNYEPLQQLASVLGLSTQAHEAQFEFAEREHIPFPLLSDPDRKVGNALRLPTFEVDGTTLYKRVTLIVHQNVIEHVRYPVFPPDQDANEVLQWLRNRV